MSQYSDAVLQRYYHSDYCGVIEAGEGVGVAQVGTAESGEVLRIHVQLNPTGVITQVRFKAQGCAALIAAADWVCERVDQQPSQVLASFSHEELIQELDLPRVKIHSALLAMDAMKAAIKAALS